MRGILAASCVGVALMSAACWGRILPIHQQGPPSASSPIHIADDEWAMIEAACRNQKLFHSHAAYMDCLGRQVRALEASPGKPSLAGISDEQRAAIESACKNQRLSHGPSAYYNCLGRQLAAPNAAPVTASALTTGATPKPHTPPPGSRAAQASATSTEAAKPPASPAQQDKAAGSVSNGASSPAATPSSTVYGLEVLAIIIVAAIGAWLSWKIYPGFRRPKCARCGHRFRGSSAYCPACIAVFQETTRQAAAQQQRRAEQQARAEEWNRETQRAEEESREQQQRNQPTESEPVSAFDPYVVLGVPRNASMGEIRAAYLRQMASYHPDKVAHLGDDLQELAMRKAQAINRAYAELLQTT